MSAEIVKTTEVLPNQEEVAQQLDKLESTGDTQRLNEVARMARAYQEYEARAGATERANHFGRIKVMAEARIGTIDLDLHPLPRGGQLEFDGWLVPQTMRSNWRTLGMGLRVGQLDKAMALIESNSESVSTHQVVRELRETGVLWVWSNPLLERYRLLYRTEGLRVKQVEEMTGIRHLGSWLTRPGTKPSSVKMHRYKAECLAKALGLDPRKLKSAPSPRKSSARQRRLPKAKPLTGGRLDETYTLIRRALKELDAAAGTGGEWGTAEAYEHLYKAEEIIGRALKRAAVDA